MKVLLAGRISVNKTLATEKGGQGSDLGDHQISRRILTRRPTLEVPKRPSGWAQDFENPANVSKSSQDKQIAADIRALRIHIRWTDIRTPQEPLNGHRTPCASPRTHK